MIKKCINCGYSTEEENLYHGELCGECTLEKLDDHDHKENCDIEAWLLDHGLLDGYSNEI